MGDTLVIISAQFIAQAEGEGYKWIQVIFQPIDYRAFDYMGRTI